LVLVLAVAAFFFLQKYMIYTDDGKGHLELPAFSELFSSRRGGDPDPLESEDTAVIVVTPTPAPTPTPEPALKAVWLHRRQRPPAGGSGGRQCGGFQHEGR
jgi:hypothetical protein